MPTTIKYSERSILHIGLHLKMVTTDLLYYLAKFVIIDDSDVSHKIHHIVSCKSHAMSEIFHLSNEVLNNYNLKQKSFIRSNFFYH